MKKRVIRASVVIVIIALLTVWGLQVKKINERYPAPDVNTGEFNKPYKIMNRDITVKGYAIRELDSLLDDMELTRKDVSLNTNDEINVMLVEVEVKELEKYDLYEDFDIMYSVVESDAWFNGVDREIYIAINGDKLENLYDEKQNSTTVILPFTMYKVRFSNKSWKNLEDKEYNLVFNWYPVKKQIAMQ